MEELRDAILHQTERLGRAEAVVEAVRAIHLEYDIGDTGEGSSGWVGVLAAKDALSAYEKGDE